MDNRKPAPNIQISTNINIISIEKKSDGSLEVPFFLTISYGPSIAQMSLKGIAFVQGVKMIIEFFMIRTEKAAQIHPTVNIYTLLSQFYFKNTKYSNADSITHDT